MLGSSQQWCTVVHKCECRILTTSMHAYMHSLRCLTSKSVRNTLKCLAIGVAMFEDWNLAFNAYGSYLSINRELQQSKHNTTQQHNPHSLRVERKIESSSVSLLREKYSEPICESCIYKLRYIVRST